MLFSCHLAAMIAALIASMFLVYCRHWTTSEFRCSFREVGLSLDFHVFTVFSLFIVLRVGCNTAVIGLLWLLIQEAEPRNCSLLPILEMLISIIAIQKWSVSSMQIHTCIVYELLFNSHMPIGMLGIYRLLFVCLCVFVSLSVCNGQVNAMPPTPAITKASCQPGCHATPTPLAVTSSCCHRHVGICSSPNNCHTCWYSVSLWVDIEGHRGYYISH